MPKSTTPSDQPSRLFKGHNYLLAGVALAVIVVGYLVLGSGRPSLASVLLVLGYVVLVPLALLS